MGEGRREDWYFARIDTLWRPRATAQIVEVNEGGVEGRICGSGLEGC